LQNEAPDKSGMLKDTSQLAAGSLIERFLAGNFLQKHYAPACPPLPLSRLEMVWDVHFYSVAGLTIAKGAVHWRFTASGARIKPQHLYLLI